MRNEVSLKESRTIMSVASDMRPDENVHSDPGLSTAATPKGRPVTREESARIMALATNMRPLENVHPGEEAQPGD